MPDLSTSIMGIPLKSPIIVGANNLNLNNDNLKKMEEQGAAAIVYKSLFEEQIQIEAYQLEQELTQYNDRAAEMVTLFPQMQHSGASSHLTKLRHAIASVSIPVIASLNATNEDTWIEYSGQLADSGVSALELNFYSTPIDFDKPGSQLEEEMLNTLSAIRKKVKIPISLKLSPYYSNALHLIKEIDKLGIDGFILFNRLFQPDIDIHNEESVFPWNLSREGDLRLSLRYAGLLYENISASIIANSGVLNAYDAIQAILAGANAVQVVSTLYYNGIDYISQILQDMQDWMEEKDYHTISDFHGRMSKNKINDPLAYNRSQYVDILFQKSDQVLNKYPLP